MFVKNDEHLSPSSIYTTVCATHPNINQRVESLDVAIKGYDKNHAKTSLIEPLIDEENN